MTAKIQVRRDTSALWTSNNPTLAAGEFGYETDTGRFKIGDGSAAWTDLPYSESALPYIASGNTNLNLVTRQGRYRYTSGSACSNRPANAAGAGLLNTSPFTGGVVATDGGACLTVMRYDSKADGAVFGDYIIQTFTTDGDESASPDIPSKSWYRVFDGGVSPSGAWTLWYPITNWAARPASNPTLDVDDSDGTDVRGRRVVTTGMDLYKRDSGNNIRFLGMPSAADQQWVMSLNPTLTGSNTEWRLAGNNTAIRASNNNGVRIGEENTSISSSSKFTTFGDTLLAQNNIAGTTFPSVQIGNANKDATLNLFGNLILQGSAGTLIDMNGRRVTEVANASGATTDAMNVVNFASRIYMAVWSAADYPTPSSSIGSGWSISANSGTSITIEVGTSGQSFYMIGFGFSTASGGVQGINVGANVRQITLTSANDMTAFAAIAFLVSAS